MEIAGRHRTKERKHYGIYQIYSGAMGGEDPAENEKMLVLAKLCNRQWEGELKKRAIRCISWASGAPTIGGL